MQHTATHCPQVQPHLSRLLSFRNTAPLRKLCNALPKFQHFLPVIFGPNGFAFSCPQTPLDFSRQSVRYAKNEKLSCPKKWVHKSIPNNKNHPPAHTLHIENVQGRPSFVHVQANFWISDFFLLDTDNFTAWNRYWPGRKDTK